MIDAPAALSSTQAIAKELDEARRRGPLQTIVIPPSPAILERMRQAMASAEPDLNEIANIATSDVAMSAQLIKAANSPAYSTGQPVQTIGQAMNRLGLDITAAEMTRFIVSHALPVRSAQLTRFWERSSKRAVAMGYIAAKLPGMSKDVAHTYGLFCHVGMPVMLQSVKGYAGTLVEANARIDRSFVATENANHRTDHAVVGALVARMWKLSPTVMAAIRRHHDLDMLGTDGDDAEMHTLVATGLVAEHLMRRHEGLDADADWKQHKERVQAWLLVDDDELSHWEEELAPLLDIT
jgi:HD-like signal output (HDOD) protein